MASRSLRLILVYIIVWRVDALFNTTKSTNPYAHLLQCNLTPLDSAWPSPEDWTELSSTVNGALLRSAPAASSCYNGNTLDSPQPCAYVEKNWGGSALHEGLPESIDFPDWANFSCLPPGAAGYKGATGCNIGGYPQYIVNVTSAEQATTALQWASNRNIRVVVKGTGHDLNGR